MSWPQLATLNGSNLPPQFSYKPYIPEKRMTTVKTANAVILQAANPQIVHGEQFLSWECPTCTPTEFKSLWDLFNTTSPTIYTFVGYWGESLEVYFTKLDPPKVKGRIFDLSGEFQVMCVTSSYSAAAC